MTEQPIRTIIVEDEPPARMKLQAFVGRMAALQLVGSYASAEEALPALQRGEADLLFLDIQIEGGMSGLELLKRLDTSPRVVMTTAYEEYALRGFELGVVDYLLKPYSMERFERSVERAVRDLSIDRPSAAIAATSSAATASSTSTSSVSASASSSASSAESQPARERYLAVRSEHRIERIPLSEILYVEGMKDYLRIHTATRRVMTLMSFAALAAELPEGEFVRVHKSYMVSAARVKAVGRDSLEVEGGVQIPVGRAYKEAVFRYLCGSK